jgi:hypothetical protein
MPIIINEFEIIPAPPPEQAESASPAGRQEGKEEPALRPEDIERILERQRLRSLRVRAD